MDDDADDMAANKAGDVDDDDDVDVYVADDVDVVDAHYGPKINVKLTTNKEELAFLMHMLLIKPLHSTCPCRKLYMQEIS
jgi:hypothetical protein